MSICNKSYIIPPGQQSYSDTSEILFGKGDPLFDGNCSWRCNQFIKSSATVAAIDVKNDTCLSDYNSVSSCIIGSPVNSRITYEVLLSNYFMISNGTNFSNQDSTEVYFTGFLLSNGNRKTKEDYYNYSRIKKAKIYINKSYIGDAVVKDTPKAQYIMFDKAYQLLEGNRIVLDIVISEVYKGKLKKWLAISEILLDGEGGHSLSWKYCYD
ncbi:MAG: NADase-type glycan-binding domain-containing protein [Cytophagaceae bacterium]